MRSADGGVLLLGFDTIARPSRITSGGELGLLRVALDVFANALGRQALEHARERLQQRLHQARRLETVGALASGIAHNFTNITAAILGYTEMAAERDGADGIIAEIRRAGERAQELVSEILSFAQPRNVDRSLVRVDALVAETLSLLRASLPASVELAVCRNPDPAVVAGVPRAAAAGHCQSVQ